MKKVPVTAVILARNEEANLPRCIQSLQFCEHIVVIDDHSTDSTAAVAKKAGAEVRTADVHANFASARNAAMKQAETDWVLFVDADEEVSHELRSSLQEIIENPSYEAYYVRRRDFWWSTELRYGETMKVRNTGLIRLIRKGAGVWKGAVHEEFVPKAEAGRLSGFLNHYPHQTLKEFIHDINMYSSSRAEELHHAGISASVFHVLAYPSAKFLVTYILRGGFLDGPAGFAYAFLMSFHSFLVRAKLYQYTLKASP